MNSALEDQILAKNEPGRYPADIEVYKHIINLSDESLNAA